MLQIEPDKLYGAFIVLFPPERYTPFVSEVQAMDCRKTGTLIYTLRREAGLTQQALAELIHVSDKAISKWERGLGCPDLSILPQLARVFDISVDCLLAGDLGVQDEKGVNMKRLKFYVCPACGGISTATGIVDISCCGRKLKPLEAADPPEADRLRVETVETDYYITTDHPMSREHYISFIAFVNADTVIMKKLYPEWNVDVRIPWISRGLLVWYCTECGLFSQKI